MPTPQQILDGLGTIAGAWPGLAIAWHLVYGAALVALVLGWRPAKRLAGALLAIPPVSVSVLAWLTGNVFNGLAFALLAAALGALALSLAGSRVQIGAPWAVVAGVALIAFGWAYPHFLPADAGVAYLYAAPLGLLPCPTLAAIVGTALVVDGLGSRAWSLVLAGGAALYGAVGWRHLGVTVDGVLLVGGLMLGIAVTFCREPASPDAARAYDGEARSVDAGSTQ